MSFWRMQSAGQDDDGRNHIPLGQTPTGATTFDPMEHARASASSLDPASFSSAFMLPAFARGGPAGSFGFDMGIVEPERPSELTNKSYENIMSNNRFDQPSSYASASFYRPQSSIPGSPLPLPYASSSNPATVPATVPASYQYTPSQYNPVYAPYGSSIVSVNAIPGSSKAPTLSMPPSYQPMVGQTAFDPASLALPVPPPAGTTTNFAGLYSSSGFDMLSVLARVAARPHPTIQIGPVDTSCAFLVVDARKWDMPIVFASGTFEKMTGYSSGEIIGRNCRFLQSPDAITAQGAPRKYTDGNATWHMRSHITTGKESQSSLINYKKGGKPFINLVTIIPIAWDTDEIAYYVGFQVDLVDQPNAILDRMKDGTYVVNYSLLNNPPKSISMQAIQANEVEEWNEGKASILAPPTITIVPDMERDMPNMAANLSLSLETDGDESQVVDILHKLDRGMLSNEKDKKNLNKFLLNNSDDFIHVLSLKGSMLYCSPSSAQILEYSPAELVGKTLSALCHPSDVVPVLRELKESGSLTHQNVSLLYRIRRKHSGYIWIEATGKLHIEPGKGRKCVILVGRPREVYKMSWNELRRSGGLGDNEFWTKLSPEGMVLSSTSSVQNVLGFMQADMVGTSLFQLVKPEAVTELRSALMQCKAGAAVTVRHQLKSRRGFVQVVTRFYPRRVDPMEDDIPVDDDTENCGPRHVSIIAQINEVSSEERKDKGSFFHQAPAYQGTGESPMSEISMTSGKSSKSGLNQSSNFKALSHPSLVADNVFDELDTTRCTSWQYELHQLENLNKKLREEKEFLINLKRKRAEFQSASPASRGGFQLASPVPRSCVQCRTTDIKSWMSGPNGHATLCEDCGSRWAGGGRDRNSSMSEGGITPSFSPYAESLEGSASPVVW